MCCSPGQCLAVLQTDRDATQVPKVIGLPHASPGLDGYSAYSDKGDPKMDRLYHWIAESRDRGITPLKEHGRHRRRLNVTRRLGVSFSELDRVAVSVLVRVLASEESS
jgi:hypothetical protein